MRGWLTSALLFVALHLAGQQFVIDSQLMAKYPFIRWNTNELSIPGDSSHFRNLFSRLDGMLAGKRDHVHFFHIGGSHIQADIYSNRIRTYLQRLAPGFAGSRGFVFPYKMARTNNPANYVVDYTGNWRGVRCSIYNDTITWGLSGVSAFTTDSSNFFSLASPAKSSNPFAFEGIRVFHNGWEPGYQVRPCDPAHITAEEHCPELGYSEFYFDTLQQNMTFEVFRGGRPAGDERFILMGTELIGPQEGVEYTSIGVNGAGFDAFRRCAYFEAQLGLYHPDVFIISIGTNDTYTSHFDTVRFERNYRWFVDLIYRNNPECAVIFTVPNDSYYMKRTVNKNTRVARRIIYRLAKEYNGAVWDFYAIMGGYGSSYKWYKAKLMPYDRIHFTRDGYAIKGDLFIEAFLHAWERMTGRPEDELLSLIRNPS